MEKSKPTKLNLLKLLPKAAAPPPFSPGRDRATTSTAKAFSGPIRFRPSNNGSGFDEAHDEPTSPKVSCMGQIKKNKNKKKIKNKNKEITKLPLSDQKDQSEKKKEKKIGKFMFGRSFKHGTVKSTVGDHVHEEGGSRAPPMLGQMRKFASGRETLGNFEWRERGSDGEEEEEEGEINDVIIPFSAPILMEGERKKVEIEPKKEINLWKRRTMAAPSPLELRCTKVSQSPARKSTELARYKA